MHITMKYANYKYDETMTKPLPWQKHHTRYVSLDLVIYKKDFNSKLTWICRKTSGQVLLPAGNKDIFKQGHGEINTYFTLEQRW